MNATAARPALICGVDPGTCGSIAYYNLVKKDLEVVYDMPTITRTMSKGTIRRSLDLFALSQIVDSYAHQTRFAVVEDVSSLPNDGAVQAFRFGHSAGATAGILTAFGIPIHFTRPAVWKALMGLTYDKDVVRATAMRKFPNHEALFYRKRDDGRAESSLLALFGAERFATL